MGMQRRYSVGTHGAAGWALLVGFALVAATGCTMCPDPFDYSGPVPNGSPPQNDFMARSKGILPLDAAPRPWPLIVKGNDEPTPVEPPPAVVAESPEETESVLR